MPKKGKAKRCPMMHTSAHCGLSLMLLVVLVGGCATGNVATPQVPVAPPPVYEQGEVTYEQQWYAGEPVIVASTGPVQVAVMLAFHEKELPAKTLGAGIKITNGSDRPLVISPDTILAYAVDDTGERPLKVYSPEEYEKMMKPTK